MIIIILKYIIITNSSVIKVWNLLVPDIILFILKKKVHSKINSILRQHIKYMNVFFTMNYFKSTQIFTLRRVPQLIFVEHDVAVRVSSYNNST